MRLIEKQARVILNTRASLGLVRFRHMLSEHICCVEKLANGASKYLNSDELIHTTVTPSRLMQEIGINMGFG